MDEQQRPRCPECGEEQFNYGNCGPLFGKIVEYECMVGTARATVIRDGGGSHVFVQPEAPPVMRPFMIERTKLRVADGSGQ